MYSILANIARKFLYVWEWFVLIITVFIIVAIPIALLVPSQTSTSFADTKKSEAITATSVPAIAFVKPIATPSTMIPTIAQDVRDCQGGCTSEPAWCAPAIKGNVSYNTGEKIYHVPGQEYYSETRINTSYGERWFCTEDEARAAGWRKSRQ